jgi:hypothetical protein
LPTLGCIGYRRVHCGSELPDAAFTARLKADARDLRKGLAMPPLCSAPVTYDGADCHRLNLLSCMTAAAKSGLLATTAPHHHPDRRRLADVLTDKF